LRLAAEPIMTGPLHVVVGYDFSQSGRSALQRAATLAARWPGHVLHVLCAVHPDAPVPSLPARDVDSMYAARVQEALAIETQRELDALDIHHTVHFFVHARIDAMPARAILALAAEVGAELVIVGSHGLHGVERLLLGSTSERVVREAKCTVEVARPKRYPTVELATIVPVEPDRQHYVPPHRYEYEDHRVNLRPPEWPLY
jgi:nucleotide-binding universal stress UspA family protein